MINYIVAYICTLNKVTDNYACIKMTGNDPLKILIFTCSRLLPKEYLATPAFNWSHLIILHH